MQTKSDLSPATPLNIISKLTRKIERTVCDIAISLMSLSLAWELQEKVEKAMECLRLVYWLATTFLKSGAYSDVYTECLR